MLCPNHNWLLPAAVPAESPGFPSPAASRGDRPSTSRCAILCGTNHRHQRGRSRGIQIAEQRMKKGRSDFKESDGLFQAKHRRVSQARLPPPKVARFSGEPISLYSLPSGSHCFLRAVRVRDLTPNQSLSTEPLGNRGAKPASKIARRSEFPIAAGCNFIEDNDLQPNTEFLQCGRTMSLKFRCLAGLYILQRWWNVFLTTPAQNCLFYKPPLSGCRNSAAARIAFPTGHRRRAVGSSGRTWLSADGDR